MKLLVVVAVKLVVAAVVVELVEEAAGVCQVFVAAGSENQVTWEVFDAVEGLSCVLVRESLFGWVDSEGRSLAGLTWRMEAGPEGAQHHWRYQEPWILQEFRSPEQSRQTVLQGCWLGGKEALTSGSAIREDISE